MALKRKHVTLKLLQKIEILDKLKEGCSGKEIAAQYNIGRATIYDLKKREAELRSYVDQMDSSLPMKEARKVIRKSEAEQLNVAVYTWYMQQRKQGVHVTGTIIREKAIDFNNKLGTYERFAASDGWLCNWKKKYGIKLSTAAGEGRPTNEKYEEFKRQSLNLIEEEALTPAQVYNVDEAELDLKSLPSKLLGAICENENEVREYKLQKERITILACCNADGSHKFPLMLIGGSQLPRCFEHKKLSTLPVEYRPQKEEAWMDSDFFSQWFHDKFVPAVKENLEKNNLPLKAVILIDNAPSDSSHLSLQSGGIRAFFLPPCVSSMNQPMNQGILESIKRRYRYKLLSSVIEKSENNSIEAILKAWNKINMRDVIFAIAAAWAVVQATTTSRCWHKIWPTFPPINEELPLQNNLFVEMFQKLPGGLDIDEENISAWFNEETCETDLILTDDEIIISVKQEEKPEIDENEEKPVNENETSAHEEVFVNVKQERYESDEDKDREINECENVEKSTKISHAAAAEAAETVLQYLRQQPDTHYTDIMLVERLRDIAYHRQTSFSQQI